MKRMKRLSYLLVFALLMTTLFSGTSVFAGEGLPNPENINVKMEGTNQIELSFTMDNKFMNVVSFDFTSVRKDEGSTPKTITKNRDSAYSISDNKITYRINLEDLFEYDGKYAIQVMARGYNSGDISATRESNEFQITLPKKETPSPGPGGGGGGGGTTPKTINIISGPKITGLKYDQRLLKKRIVVSMSGYGQYNTDVDSTYKYVNEKTIKLYSNGKYIGEQTTDKYEVEFKNVPVKYNAKNSLKAEIFMTILGKEISGGSITYTVPGGKLGKNKVYATKANSKLALVSWTGVSQATGYIVYKGGKKYKQVKAKVRRISVKGKGAGKAKYKVVPIIKSGKTTHKGTSGTAKPKANVCKTNRSVRYKNSDYGHCVFTVTKIELSGKTYKVTGYACNNRVFKMKRYSKLAITIKVDGKVVAKKTFKNKKVGVKSYKCKKLVLKIKGKAAKDLRNGSVSWGVTTKPYWEVVGNKTFD